MKLLMFVFGIVFAVTVIHADDSETIKGAKKDIDKFKKEMTVKLESLEKQIQQLRAKAEAKGDEAKTKAADEYAATQKDVKAKVDQATDETGDGWQKMKKGLAESIDSLNKKVQKALKE